MKYLTKPMLACLTIAAVLLLAATASGAQGGNACPVLRDTGPAENVDNVQLSLSLQLDTSAPTADGNLVFSGYLMRTDDNSGLANENVTIYKILTGENVKVGSATTGENGHFTSQVGAPGQGIICYRAGFSSDNRYENSESLRLAVNTLDKGMVFGVYVAALLLVVATFMFLLGRGIPRGYYLMPMLLGFVLGFLLLQIGAADLGILGAGLIAGYLFAKKAVEWIKHMRIGFMTGFLFLPVIGIVISYVLAWTPEKLYPRYSICQGDVFMFLLEATVFYLVYYLLLAGIGSVLGGMLRKILKPREQKQPNGSGGTTSSGVEQE